MSAVYLLPPVAFLVVLACVWLQSRAMDVFRMPRPPGLEAPGLRKPYASGEDVDDHRAQPDYGEFFHFACFFTIMHVVALVVATVPRGNGGAAAVAVGFLGTAAVGLLVLFRR